MIYNQTALPSIFHVQSRALEDVEAILDAHGLSTNRALVLCGRTQSRQIAEAIRPQFTAADIEIVSDYSEYEVKRLHSVAQAARSTLLIAVGGGGVIDVAKRLSKCCDVSCLVIPSIVSNDGLMSPISVLKTNDEHWESLPAAMPIGIIADLDIVVGAPRRYLRAAGGDLLSNISATSDWRHIVERGDGPRMNDIAFHLSRNSAEALIHWENCDLGDPEFIRNLIVAQIYSGIAMSIAGTSRPCSGPEHLISHALDELELTPNVLHGVQVGSACLFILHLLDELTFEVQRFARAMQIPALWTDLLPVGEPVEQVLARARKVRPDRRTILDDFTDDELRVELGRFEGREKAITGALDDERRLSAFSLSS